MEWEWKNQGKTPWLNSNILCKLEQIISSFLLSNFHRENGNHTLQGLCKDIYGLAHTFMPPNERRICSSFLNNYLFPCDLPDGANLLAHFALLGTAEPQEAASVWHVFPAQHSKCGKYLQDWSTALVTNVFKPYLLLALFNKSYLVDFYRKNFCHWDQYSLVRSDF